MVAGVSQRKVRAAQSGVPGESRGEGFGLRQSRTHGSVGMGARFAA